MQNPVEKLFELWMAQNHPYYFLVVGAVNVILILSLIASIVLSFYDVSWWWKSTLLIIVLIIIHRKGSQNIMDAYISDFKSGKDKARL